MEWAQRETEREREEKRGEVIKKGREEEERRKGENESLSKSGGAWSLLF